MKFPLEYSKPVEAEDQDFFTPRFIFDSKGRTILPVGRYINLVHSVTPGSKTVRVETEDEKAEGVTTGNYLDGVLVEDNIPERIIRGNMIQLLTILGENIADATIAGEKLENLSITANQIAKLTITSAEIEDLAIYGAKIAQSTITYDKLFIEELSAITANLGYVTAGTLVGTIIKTAESGARIQADSTGLTAYGRSVIFVDLESNSCGRIYGESTELYLIADNNIKISAGGPILCYAEGVINWYADANAFYPRKDVIPFFDNTFDLGSETYEWKDVFIDGTLQTDTLRVDQEAGSGELTCNKYWTINLNGVEYNVPCQAAA